MTLLEVREASFAQSGRTVVGPVTLHAGEGAHVAHVCDSDDAADALARLACAMLRPTAGSVFVGAFDSRIQPAQIKRLAGYVPHEVLPPGFRSFERYIEYRADICGTARAQAIVYARSLRERLHGVHEAFAFPLIGALIARPQLLVLDRPQVAYAAQIVEVTQNIAVFSTHTHDAEARIFASGGIAV